MQTVILAAERCRLLRAAKTAAGLPAIPEDPTPCDSIDASQLQDAELPQTNQEKPPIIAFTRLDDNQLYDTEADDEDLELSGTQLSGSKEALEDPPEDEGPLKRAKKATPTHVETNE